MSESFARNEELISKISVLEALNGKLEHDLEMFVYFIDHAFHVNL